ncbi:MAG: hypothetical protein SNG10_06335 [Rikenellaceae bacterium]
MIARQIYLLPLFIIVTICNIVAADSSDYKSEVVDRFLTFYQHGIDEKLYLQTDKPLHYSTADTIWFKGFLVNAITHIPMAESNFIYVQLIDEKGYLVKEVKVKRRDDSGFNGYIPLDSELEAGNYSIRGYTKWMSGSDNDLFFEKTLKLITPIVDFSSEDEGVSQRNKTREEKREAKAEKSQSKSLEARSGRLDFFLYFFPEGGALAADVVQNVAFKAVAEDGLSIEVKGYLYNSKDQRIGQFASSHLGMGVMQICVPYGEEYYVKVTSSEELTKKIALPKSSLADVGLTVKQVGEYVYYQPISIFPQVVEPLKAIIHSRGRIITIDEGELKNGRRIALKSLYPGVNVISLVNLSGDVVAERIFFKRPEAMPSIDISPDSNNYPSRSKATISLNIKSSDGKPAQGEFAVSVVDANAIESDPAQDNILSYLLLSSEIKGHIESPGLYFADNSRLTDHKLDLLMMTQGWRRFDLERILDSKTDFKRGEIYESVVNITGQVKSFWGTKARKTQLSVLSLNEDAQFFNIYNLDSTNVFNIKNVNIPEYTNFMIRVKGNNNGKYYTLKVDKERLPESKAAKFAREESVMPFYFVNQTMEKFYDIDNLRNIEIKSVIVVADEADGMNYSRAPQYVETRADLRPFRKKSFFKLLHTYPDISVNDYEVYYKSGTDTIPQRPVKFFVNGNSESAPNVSLLTMDMIKKVEFYDEYIFDTSSDLSKGQDTGTFQITLVEGAVMPYWNMPNTVIHSPLGYQRTKTFYHPQYNTPLKREKSPKDYRITIYWSGDISPDEDGNAEFEFYTADKDSSYRIIVEGVTTQGEVCHSEALVRRDSH